MTLLRNESVPHLSVILILPRTLLWHRAGTWMLYRQCTMCTPHMGRDYYKLPSTKQAKRLPSTQHQSSNLLARAAVLAGTAPSALALLATRHRQLLLNWERACAHTGGKNQRTSDTIQHIVNELATRPRSTSGNRQISSPCCLPEAWSCQWGAWTASQWVRRMYI